MEYKYQILAGKKKDENNYDDATVINLSAKNEKEAIKKAKSILKRKDYHIRGISEIEEWQQPKFPPQFMKLLEKLIKKI